MNPIFTKPFRTRPRPTGVLSLAASASATYSGVNARQDRYAIYVTNLDATLPVYVQFDGVNGTSVRPLTTQVFPVQCDVTVYNPDGATSLNYMVLELFYDEGTKSGGLTDRDVAWMTGGNTAGGTSGGGGGTSGGYSAPSGGLTGAGMSSGGRGAGTGVKVN